jgi:hypothetical protein
MTEQISVPILPLLAIPSHEIAWDRQRTRDGAGVAAAENGSKEWRPLPYGWRRR